MKLDWTTIVRSGLTGGPGIITKDGKDGDK